MFYHKNDTVIRPKLERQLQRAQQYGIIVAQQRLFDINVRRRIGKRNLNNRCKSLLQPRIVHPEYGQVGLPLSKLVSAVWMCVFGYGISLLVLFVEIGVHWSRRKEKGGLNVVVVERVEDE